MVVLESLPEVLSLPKIEISVRASTVGVSRPFCHYVDRSYFGELSIIWVDCELISPTRCSGHIQRGERFHYQLLLQYVGSPLTESLYMVCLGVDLDTKLP